MEHIEKELTNVTREKIANAAEALFLEKGFDKTLIRDIIKKAGCSKSTLYVYFESKDAIMSYLVLRSMQMFYCEISEITSPDFPLKDNFINICYALLHYSNAYPLYFDLLLDTINVDFSDSRYFKNELETYLVGQDITDYISFLLPREIRDFQHIFTIWSSLCGMITIVKKKSDRIMRETGQPAEEFLANSFEILYRMLV